MDLRKLILLACLMLIFSTQQVGATSVLAVRKKVGSGYCIWIGADTASSMETKDGNKSVNSVPKIIKLAPLTYFVAAGYFTYQSKKYSIKFNAYLSAKDAYQLSVSEDVFNRFQKSCSTIIRTWSTRGFCRKFS